jgi:CheY-like chemotaxis protein
MKNSIKNILVVDNDVDTVEMISGLFEVLQYKVFRAYDGHEAISLAGKHKLSSIVLDIGLPGLDGFAIARKLRQFPEYTQSTIVGFSGHGGKKYLDQAQSTGMDFYLLKPCDPEILVACLDPESHPGTLIHHVGSMGWSTIKGATSFSGAWATSMRSRATIMRANRTLRAARDNLD